MFDLRDLTVRLEGASSRRLVLRRMAYADAWPLFDATRVSAFNEHLLWTRPTGIEEARARVRVIVDDAARGDIVAMSAMHKQTGEWIGVFRFLRPVARQVSDALEMGIWMHPRFWAGRYSFELSCLCIERAFEDPRVARLIASTMPENRGAERLMESVGMVRIGHSERALENGLPMRVQDFDLTRDAWLLRRRRSRATTLRMQA